MGRSAKPEKLGANRWRIRWHDHQGVRRSRIFATHDDATRALRQKQTEADDIARGFARPQMDHSFDELAAHWLAGRGASKRSAKDDASIIRRHLLPAFSGHRLVAIRELQIDAYRDARLASLAPKTVRNHLTLLGTMLSEARRIGWLALDAPDIQKPRSDESVECEPPWLRTQGEIDRLLRAAKTVRHHADPSSELPFVVYSTALYTGMRLGEIAGLTWDNVDLVARTIHVVRSFDGRTKTRASRRYVPIMDVLLPVLRAWRLRCPPNPENLVFPNRAGRMHGGSAQLFQETLHRTLDTAGFKRPTRGRNRHFIHFHSMRHTFACHWRLNGGSLEELIRVLGHTSRQMTEHYANVGGYHKPEHFRLFPSREVANE